MSKKEVTSSQSKKIMKKKEVTIVLIPDGESRLCLNVIRCLSSIKTIQLHLLASDSHSPMQFSRYVRSFSHYQDDAPNKRMEAIIAAVQKTKANIVLPIDEPTILLLSKQGKSIANLARITPIPELESFLIAKNKWLLAQWLNKTNISCPPTLLFENTPDFYTKLNTIPFPVLLKPTDGEGGEGIVLFERPSSLKTYMDQLGTTEEHIVQSCIEGHPIICNVLCVEGKILAHTIQKSTIKGANPYSPARGNRFIKDENTLKLVTEITTTFRWTGVVNFDLYYDTKKKEITVLEMNPRFWGSLIGSIAAGINFPFLCCLYAEESPLPKNDYQEVTFVNGTPALRILLKTIMNGTFFNKNREQFVFHYLLNDPLPNLALYSKGLFLRLKKMIREGAL